MKKHTGEFRAFSSEADQASRRENATTKELRAFPPISMIGKRSKREAVRLALSRGLTRDRAALDLGVGKSTLNRWLSRYAPSDPSASPPQMDLAQENERLRREVRILKEEREILKKATQVLASQKL